MNKKLIDTLVGMNGYKADGSEARIYDPKRNAWLSGAPYLWSCFSERAYVFPSQKRANDVIANFPELSGCVVKTASE